MPFKKHSNLCRYNEENVDEVIRAPDSKRKFPADGGLGFAKPGSEHLLLSVNSEGVLEGNGYSQPAGGFGYSRTCTC